VDRFPANDRYTPVALLGAGATSRVYAVEDARNPGKHVALKLLETVRENDFEAARDEFLLLSRLDHPQLTPVLDFGRLGAERLPYFTQAIIRGERPQDYVAGDPLKAAAVVAQVAWALAYVHGHGVLHLDIKPDNVRVEDGLARLLDFGLARRPDEIGRAGGTVAFMAPEVLGGRAFDHRADLYGLGALLYALVAGRPPFVGATFAEVVEQILFTPPLPLDSVAPDCPAALAVLAERLLSPDPQARPDSAVAVVREVAALDGVVLPPLKPGTPDCIGREAAEGFLAQAHGLIRLRGPAGIGKRTLMRRRLNRAKTTGAATGWGHGRGLDALEAAIRRAGGDPQLPRLDGASSADARRAQVAALQSALTDDMVLGLVLTSDADLPPLKTRALVISATTAAGSDGLTLTPFSPEEVRRYLVTARPGQIISERDVQHATTRTGGIPALLRAFVADPDGALDLRERAAALPQAQQQALQALALLGAPASTAEASEVCGDDVSAALIALVERGLASVEEGHRYAPLPQELRMTLTAEPLVPAQAMAARAWRIAPSLGALRLAGDPKALEAALRKAIDDALELATRRAHQHELFQLTGALEDGLALEQTLDRLGLRAEQAELLGGLDPASPIVRVRRAFQRMLAGAGKDALADAAEARRLSSDPELQAHALRIDGLVAQRAGDYATAGQAFAAARAALPAEGGDPILRAHTVHDLGVAALYLGRNAEAMPCFRESLRLKLEHGDASGARIARQNLGICHEAVGEPRLALRAYEGALADARRAGALPGEAWNHMALGGLLRAMGRRDDARSHLDAAERVAQQLKQPMLSSGIATERALLDGSRETLTTAVGRAKEAGDGYNADRLGLAIAALALRAGEQPATIPGAEHFPERHAALTAVAAARAGEPSEVDDSADPIMAIARAEVLRRQDSPHEADQVLADALERTWQADERTWLREAAGGSADAALIAGEAELALQILELTRTLRSVEASAEVVDLVLDTAIDVTHAERGFLLLKTRSAVKVAAARNLDREKVQKGLQRISRGVALEVLRTGEPVRLVSAQTDTHLQVDASIQDLGLESVLCVPLRGAGDEVVGALYLDHRFRQGVFDRRVVRFVELLADQAALALDAARILEAARAQTEEVQRLNRILSEREAAAQRELADTRLLLSATRSELHTRYEYPGVLGHSRALKQVFAVLDRVIPTTLSVLLEGESGTGKELLARAVHTSGPRGEGPFTAVNCGAIPRDLFESAFFGHTRGAFTGADQDKQGFFALSNRGTLFLDEIGELPLDGQAKLLRVLETGTFWPVGGAREQRSDVRVVTATNRNLAQMVTAGDFREDLFYRVAQVRVPVPPLRERPEDIPLLVRALLGDSDISSDAIRALTTYGWPGNVRELKNEIERAVAMSGGNISADDLSPAVRTATSAGASSAGGLPAFHGDLKTYVDNIERRIVTESLKKFSGNITKTAEFLRLSRHGLRKKMERLGIQGSGET